MKKSGKAALCAVIYIAAIAAVSVLFVSIGRNQSTAAAPEELPIYTAGVLNPEPVYTTVSGWVLSGQNGEQIYTAPDGSVRFIVKRAAAYQKDLAAYAQANVRSIEAEDTAFTIPLSSGEIGGRETYIFAYTDFETTPAQYRRVYFFNAGKHTYGAMGVAESREALATADFDAIVAGFEFE